MTGMDITAPPGSGIAVVTGVSTGTGRATARAFARGAPLSSRSAGSCWTHTADRTYWSTTRASCVAVALHADAGRLTSQLCTLTPEGITSQFATNFPAPALLTRPALLPLERAGGTSSASVRQCVSASARRWGSVPGPATRSTRRAKPLRNCSPAAGRSSRHPVESVWWPSPPT